ncbi:unnamed protein product [Prunus armeniaca]|nr:hypothetical protein GBA52_002305 [Prunus armeniaca]
MAAAPVARLDGAAIHIKNLLFVFSGYSTIDYRCVVDFYISDFQSGLRALVKTGSGARVTPYVDDSIVIDVNPENEELSPEFIGREEPFK